MDPLFRARPRALWLCAAVAHDDGSRLGTVFIIDSDFNVPHCADARSVFIRMLRRMSERK